MNSRAWTWTTRMPPVPGAGANRQSMPSPPPPLCWRRDSQRGGLGAAAVGHSQYHKENPFPARLSVNQKITGRDSTKDIPPYRDQPGRVRHHLSARGCARHLVRQRRRSRGEVLALTGLRRRGHRPGPAARGPDPSLRADPLARGRSLASPRSRDNAARKDLARRQGSGQRPGGQRAQVVDVLKRFPAT